MFKLIFLSIYVGLSALITFFIHKELNPYYTPMYVTKKPKKEGELEEKVNIHDEFIEFAKTDKPINVIKLFIGVLTLFWIRFIINVILTVVLTVKINNRIKEKKAKKEELGQEDIDYIINSTKYLTKWFLRVAGIIVDNKRLPDEKVLPVFQKYFGPEYKIDYNGKFGCLISNHTCIYDMAVSMSNFGNGFVAKEAVKDIPFFGKLMTGLQTILVDRNNTNSKNNTLDKLSARQHAYYEGKPVMPFLIFPEGTTTSGRHLITFKKGAFDSLLPIKATIMNPNVSKECQLGCGSSDVMCNFLRDLSTLYSNIEYIELPIMTPNEYMFNNFKDLGKEKWEIYAEVAREIMCTLGNLKKSNFGVKDSFRYSSCLKEKTYLDRDTYKIRS
jgi:lysophosphatidylcholine acyltransferase/lyso-PAF acetyltransferase